VVAAVVVVQGVSSGIAMLLLPVMTVVTLGQCQLKEPVHPGRHLLQLETVQLPNTAKGMQV
jgi:hypothetical protein